MALRKRGDTYWIDIWHNATRIRQSTGTSNKKQAQELHDKLKQELWAVSKLGDKPKRSWQEAVERWVNEHQHKRSLKTDLSHVRYLHQHLGHLYLDQIDKQCMDRIIADKKEMGARKVKKIPGTNAVEFVRTGDIKNSSLNRLVAFVRAVLNAAYKDWEWLDRPVAFKRYVENEGRVRWLKPKEAKDLISELPEHLADMATFTLATGLRMSNLCGLTWDKIDFANRHAYVSANKAKGKTGIPIPLNSTAMKLLYKWKGKHHEYVFVYESKRILNCYTAAFKKALERCRIENFHWHDLRHTWASWHIQNGTSLQELQMLGAWKCFNMVLRYAHLSSDHLKEAANNIEDLL